MGERQRAVLWTDAAARDLEDIIAFVAVDSPANAEQVLSRLERRAISLATNPHGGRTARPSPELTSFGHFFVLPPLFLGPRFLRSTWSRRASRSTGNTIRSFSCSTSSLTAI